MAFSEFTVTLFLHISFVFIWLTALPVDLVLRSIFNDITDDPEKEYALFRYRDINNKLGIIGGLGVVATGVFMTFIVSNYGFFDFSTPNQMWLAVKQVVWLVTFMGGGVYLAPRHNKLKKMLDEKAPIDEIRAHLKSMDIGTYVFSALIVFNIFLAVTKPF